MGNAKGLVQIEMAHVGAVITRPRQADLRIEIGPIQINLPTAAMHEVADGADLRLKHAMCRRVRNHQHRKALGMLFRLDAQIIKSTFPWASQFTTTMRMPAI